MSANTYGSDDFGTYCHNYPASSKSRAQAKAWSIKQALKRGGQTVTLDLPGLVQVAANQPVNLVGFRDEMNGQWFARKITITLTKGAGIRTKIECEIPGTETPPGAAPAETGHDL